MQVLDLVMYLQAPKQRERQRELAKPSFMRQSIFLKLFIIESFKHINKKRG